MPASTTATPSTPMSSAPSTGTPTNPPSSSTRRTRPDSDDAQSGSEDERPVPKKARQAKSAAEMVFTSAGATVGMMGDLFRDFHAILEAGFEANAHSPPGALTYRQRKYLQLFQQLISIAPSIIDEIAGLGPKGTLQVARMLDAGRSGVRSVDLHGLKKAVLTWETFNPPILPEAKSIRGFNHPLCGFVNCPITYNWDLPEVRAGLQNRSQKYPVTGEDFNYGLWQDDKPDRTNLIIGFLRNARLTKAGRYVLYGPRAAQLVGQTTAARKPKAKIYRIRSITVAFIAYCAVLVHFSLSSQETFGDGSTAGTFPYEKYYQSIVRFVEESMPDKERIDLLTWWNMQIFGQVDDESSGDEDDADGGAPRSVMALMKAQVSNRPSASETVTSGSGSVPSSST